MVIMSRSADIDTGEARPCNIALPAFLQKIYTCQFETKCKNNMADPATQLRSNRKSYITNFCSTSVCLLSNKNLIETFSG